MGNALERNQFSGFIVLDLEQDIQHELWKSDLGVEPNLDLLLFPRLESEFFIRSESDLVLSEELLVGRKQLEGDWPLAFVDDRSCFRDVSSYTDDSKVHEGKIRVY